MTMNENNEAWKIIEKIKVELEMPVEHKYAAYRGVNNELIRRFVCQYESIIVW